MRTRFVPRCVVLLQPVLRPEVTGGAAQELSIPSIPLMASWTSDEPARADTAEIEVPWPRFPFDPRAIGDLRVAIYCADVEDPRVDLNAGNTEAMRFVGFADDPEVSFSGRGASVRIRARSYEGRLLDTRLAPTVYETDRPVESVIRQILGAIPFYATLPVQADANPNARARLGAKRWSPPERATVWDAIVALARDCGLWVHFDRDTLRISDPENATAERTRVLRFSGQIESLTLAHGLGPKSAKAIEVACFDPRSGQTVIGRYPTDPQAEAIRYPVAGFFPKATLDARARVLWEQFSRRQVEGRLTTPCMADLADEDLTLLRSGDGIFLQTSADNRRYVLGQSQQQIADYLTGSTAPRDLGFTEGERWVSREDAERIASAMVASDQVAPLFFVRRASHAWSAESGYSLSIDLQNFVSANG